ncbi:glycosyltransferase [Rhodocytophaga aerolata]|uniref:Glycosyltransferase n=1 Tax=Rhodocytophaga aerolata TaxID=455078 RepID=A0ABT8RGG4_9BACT|nr:glycosyltransferase [Rhodocytophaga aerolata]MDO1449802.1 glycosyltransferase [Rhodocytophaga aerolata]
MKILHVTPSYFPAVQFGGPIQSVHLLNKTLVTEGVLVDVFTTNAGLENFPEFCSRKWKNIDGVKVKYFSYYGYIHYNLSPQLLISLLKAVSEYDLVHITAIWNFPVWAAATACKRAGVPYIISPRGTIYPETVDIRSTLLKKIYYKVLAKRCLQNASAIHYTAIDEQSKVTNFLQLPTASFVIPNGIDLNEYRNLEEIPPFVSFYPELTGKTYILFLSRINVKKGLDILVKAFFKVSVHFPELMLVIAGPDNEGYGTIIREELNERGMLNKTLFTGMLSGETKLAAYRDAEVFVLPSYSENFGMSVVEAMASATPVIISDKVGIAEDIKKEEAGIIVNTNVENVQEAIIALLADNHKKKEIAENGKKMAKTFYDINAVVKKIILHYKKTICSYEKENSRVG